MKSAAAHADPHDFAHHTVTPAMALRKENISLPPDSGKGMGFGLIGLGVVLAVAALAIGFLGTGGITLKQALGVYHLTTMAVLAMSLGALFFVLVFHLTNAGWSATLRRQFENVAAFVPVAFLMVVPTLLIEVFVPNTTHLADGTTVTDRGYLFSWLSDTAAHSHVLHAKWGYFFTPGADHHDARAFPTFFLIRAALYGFVWFTLVRKLRGYSIAQDTNPDPNLSAKARFTSSWGMLLFALSTAFAAFDWLMSIDYAFFSTMWGVYYFAGAAYSGVAVTTIILAVLRSKGKLEHAVTSEHFHDLGKLMFSFTVFWAYIGFSQYFLIWYSNIPEETAFYDFRQGPQWRWLAWVLILGHFVVPFIILLFRKVKRTPQTLVLLGLWAIILELVDMYWIVRPAASIVTGHHGEGAAHAVGSMGYVVDALGILGVLAIFAGFLIQKIPQSLLVAVNDPRMPEGLGHKNYV